MRIAVIWSIFKEPRHASERVASDSSLSRWCPCSLNMLAITAYDRKGVCRNRSQVMNQYILAFALVACAEAQTPGVIAYTRAPDGAPPWPVQNIRNMRVSGSVDRCLTTDGHSHNPSWSPDGKRVLFIHDSTLSTKPPYRE